MAVSSEVPQKNRDPMAWVAHLTQTPPEQKDCIVEIAPTPIYKKKTKLRISHKNITLSNGIHFSNLRHRNDCFFSV